MKLIKLLFTQLLSLFIVCLVTGIIGSICIPYTLNTWLIYAGKEATITALNGFLFGLVPPIGLLSIFSSFGTWVAILFVL